MEFLTAISGAIALWPLPFDYTAALAILIYKMGDLIIKKQWKKLEKVAEDEAYPLFEELLEDEEKRDAVVKAVWNAMPKALKMIASADQVEKIVDSIYVTRVKPKAKRNNLVRGRSDGLSDQDEPLMHFSLDGMGRLEEETDIFGD